MSSTEWRDDPYSAAEIEAIERAARDACVYRDPHQPMTDDRWPRPVCAAVIGALSLLLWGLALGAL